MTIAPVLRSVMDWSRSCLTAKWEGFNGKLCRACAPATTARRCCWLPRGLRWLSRRMQEYRSLLRSFGGFRRSRLSSRAEEYQAVELCCSLSLCSSFFSLRFAAYFLGCFFLEC